ncbi:type I DNA topoisomerase [Bacteroidales bacterium]|nr:type I DNA topoisomerase [Bacteroidales bacterium]
MAKNVVIVESPAKAKTIEKFLGKDFLVTSSFGHIRDLAKKNLGIDIDNNFEPQYVVPTDKKKVVTELKKLVKAADSVWLASDEDREGEAIAWHLAKELNLDPKTTKRIVFHEITKDAILNAIKNPRTIDDCLVSAQQARRILDRLVGFELSPVLWKKVQAKLSAGRVQSVAVRLIVEREREINDFNAESFFRVNAQFNVKDEKGKKYTLNATLDHKFKTEEEATEFVNKCNDGGFKVNDIIVKPGKKSPSAPFTTSTLQQEASRKLGYSVSQTMSIAQKLYEAGHITYMRTDSVNLSKTAIDLASEVILKDYGQDYLKIRAYKTKAKGAQEAHEAIRPTFMNVKEIDGNNSEERLYKLIWKRTLASQMSDAVLEKTQIKIQLDNENHLFVATGEVIKFDGFIKVYFESTDDEEIEDDEGLLPPINLDSEIQYDKIEAQQRYTKHPARYAEASLVRKLEELGIGRPSTYAPTISTIQNRGYVVKEDREGQERISRIISLSKGAIKKINKEEITGAERAKLFPNDIGMLVNDFLIKHFENIMSYDFTARVESDFDNIAEGKMEWVKMIKDFYGSFHSNVEDTLENSERSSGERLLGEDPKTGKPVFVRIGRYGPLAQIGDSEDEEKKFASLLKGQLLETITLEEAIELFKLPRHVGEYESKVVVIGIGRFGPYVRHDSKFVSLKKGEDDPYTIELDRAIELIEEKREKDRKALIKKFDEEPELQLLNGRFGAYISYKKKNYKIPKGTKAEDLNLEQCMEIVNTPKEKTKTKKKKSK